MRPRGGYQISQTHRKYVRDGPDTPREVGDGTNWTIIHQWLACAGVITSLHTPGVSLLRVSAGSVKPAGSTDVIPVVRQPATQWPRSATRSVDALIGIPSVLHRYGCAPANPRRASSHAAQLRCDSTSHHDPRRRGAAASRSHSRSTTTRLFKDPLDSPSHLAITAHPMSGRGVDSKAPTLCGTGKQDLDLDNPCERRAINDQEHLLERRGQSGRIEADLKYVSVSIRSTRTAGRLQWGWSTAVERLRRREID